MKEYQLTVLSPAYLDMTAAIKSLSEYSENAAARFVDSIEDCFNQIEKWPNMYAVYDDFPLYRKVSVMDYLIFYVVDHQTATVDVHRIVYGKRDVSKLLSADEQ